MGIMHKVKFEISITPTYHDSVPKIKYGINNLDNEIELADKTVIAIEEYLDTGKHVFLLDFFNKTDQDCIPEKGLDKFITINEVKIGGLSLPRFMWISQYEPVYPEPWFSEQIEKPPQIQHSATVLGFNGQWRLPFESPVFPWIHQLENLGWIWPV
jgi:hypothetical protein